MIWLVALLIIAALTGAVLFTWPDPPATPIEPYVEVFYTPKARRRRAARTKVWRRSTIL